MKRFTHFFHNIKVASRASPLAKAQVDEIAGLLSPFFPNLSFDSVAIHSQGDIDKKSSLRTMGKNDFFTREVDNLVLEGTCRVAVHSAKDLPEELPKGLKVICLTKGVDPRDSLVLKEGACPTKLEKGALIATSSFRREEGVASLYPNCRFCDLGGTIAERLSLIDKGLVDGVVVAEAALLRLGLTHLNRIRLPIEVVEGQGRLAVVASDEDEEMAYLFAPLDHRSREKTRALYLGLNPINFSSSSWVYHLPLIKIVPNEEEEFDKFKSKIKSATHILFTSKTAVILLFQALDSKTLSSLTEKAFIAVGEQTKKAIQQQVPEVKVATPDEETAEGLIAMMETWPLDGAKIFWPHSALSRPLLREYFEARNISLVESVLYTTEEKSYHPLPSLEVFDELIFTSPSTVEAFKSLYGTAPPGITLTPTGPITETALKCYLGAKEEKSLIN